MKTSGMRICAVAVLGCAGVFGNTLTVTNTNDSGAGSLRQAMLDAVAGDTIKISPKVSGTITLQSNLPVIGSNLTIAGTGPSIVTVSGGNTIRMENGHQVFKITGGSVAISGLTIANGYSINNGGGVDVEGGVVTLSDCVLSGNEASNYGGGLYVGGAGQATVNQCVIQGNTTSLGGDGGGMANLGALTVTNSTVSGNSADGGRGGILNLGSVSLTVSNSTIAGNLGAGVFSYVSATLTNVTVSGNSESGVVGTTTHPLALQNSIVSNGGNTNSKNCLGTVVSKGYNLSDDATCATFFNQGGDRNSTAAGLDPHGLQSNFGTTPTIALVAGSAGLNVIPAANCVAGKDQRGVPRPQETGCEMGAYERDVFNFTGFFAPVANLPNVNAITAGQTVTVSFSLGGNFGLKVMAAGYPVMQPVNCATGASNGNAVGVTPNLVYDSKGNTYSFGWQTDAAWRGSCGMLVVRLTDKLDHKARFSFQ